MNKLNGVISFDFLIYLLFFAFSFFGFNGDITNYIKFGLFLIWLVSVLVKNNNRVNIIRTKEFVFLFLFLLFYPFVSILNGSIINTLKYEFMYLMQLGAFIPYFIYKNDEKKRIFCVNFCLTIVTLVSINALLFYLVNPNAARNLASDSSFYDNIAIGNGYSLAYSLSILTTYLFYCLINGLIKKKKAIFFALIILYTITIFYTESTTTLLSLFFGLSITLFFRVVVGNQKNKSRTYLGYSIIFVFTIIFFFCINDIGQWLYDLTIDDISQLYARRLNRIAAKLIYFGKETSVNNYVDERFGTIALSWNTFIKNPLFGVGYKYGCIYSLSYDFGIGQHSEVADLLAQFGVLGLFLVANYLIYMNKATFKGRNIGYIISVLTLLIFNPFMSFQSCYVLFFVIPCMVENMGGYK